MPTPRPSSASMYNSGKGVPQDYAAAVSWYRKAAEQGNADAQFDLGVMYHDRPRRATGLRGGGMRWYRKAAEQGNAGAQINLGADVRQRQGRATGLRGGSVVVPQGRREGHVPAPSSTSA